MSDDQPPPNGPDRPEETSTEHDRGLFPARTEEQLEPVPPHPPPVHRPVPLGRLILGLVLLGIGVVWLLEALDVVNVSFLAVLPVALIVIGVVLVGAARTGGHRGLIALGVIITVILTIASSFDIRLRGGVGDRTERPASAADLHGEYHLSLGQLTIDLRAVALADSSTPRRLKASVGMGQLTVRIPSDSFVEATGHVGAGQVTIFGRKNSGLDVELSERALPPARSHVSAVAPLILDLSVGVGQIVVTR